MKQSTQSLDLETLAPYLNSKIDNFGKIIKCDKFSVGQSNPTFKLTTNSGRYVLRRQPPGKLLKSAHAVDREYRVMNALRNTSVPVPRVYHLCEDIEVIGSKFYVMDFAEGQQFINPALEEIEKSRRAEYYYAVVDNLAALHKLDIIELGLEDFGKGDNFFQRQIELWIRQYRAAETETRNSMETLIKELPIRLAAIIESDPALHNQKTLTHGDYKFDNLLFKVGSPELLAVLDWELSTIGHPLADLAYLCMNLRLPQQAITRGLAGVDLAAEQIPEEAALIARYCTQRNIDVIHDMPFYIAFSFFRLASICQGVYHRAISGNASNEQGKSAGAVTQSLADMGVSLLQN